MKKMIVGSMLLLMASSSFADTIKLAVGLSLPPYIIKNSNDGMEMDVIKEALKQKGHSVQIEYMPFARSISAIADGKAEAIATTNEASGIDCNFSDSHITYQNVAITLKKNGITVNSISDLKDKSVVAFQNATKYLGKEYAAMASANTKYEEKAKQLKQNMMLFSGKTQVIVGDINIFKFFNEKAAGRVDITQPYVIHEIFPKTNYKVCFKSAKIRDDFNAGLKVLKSSGQYDKILKKYVK